MTDQEPEPIRVTVFYPRGPEGEAIADQIRAILPDAYVRVTTFPVAADGADV